MLKRLIMKNIFYLPLLGLLLLSTAVYAQTEDIPVMPSVKTKIVKVDFFSPITGNLAFSYEQVLMNNITIEGNIGIIGLSFIDDPYKGKGLFIKAGPRLYFSPDYTMDGMKRYNDFQGGYFKPEIVYSGFGFDYEYYNSSYQYTKGRGVNNSVGLILNFGRQWVLAKIISLDIYGGIGYSKSWEKIDQHPVNALPYSDEYFAPYKYSHVEAYPVPLGLSAGFNIGVLLK